MPKPQQVSRRLAASAVLVEKHGDWIDQIALRRDSRGKFVALARKFCEPHTRRGHQRWIEIEKTADLTTPMQIVTALNRCAQILGIDLEWSSALPQIAKIDWCVAAIMAHQMGHEIPAIPSVQVLAAQRSLRFLGKVQVCVEWGYDLHEVWLPMQTWLHILGGERVVIHAPYRYEGQPCNSTWRFDMNAKDQLDVGIDDGGTGWIGNLDGVTVLNGPHIEGIDIAEVALSATSAQKGFKATHGQKDAINPMN